MLPPPAWTPLSRFAFRVSFLYFFCFAFFYGNGTIFSVFPVVGDWIEGALRWPVKRAAEWLGHHLFHLTGIAGGWHDGGSGDTALDWISNGIILAFALLGGMAWTGIAAVRGNGRAEYRTLYSWLRFFLRLTIGFFMIEYGVDKVFALQMAPISIGILNEPVGEISPMTFLWTLIGLNPSYEIICGLAEVIGGVLFLFRRTALLGALVTSFVMTNVLLYNLFFDIPVKLFAANLLLAALFVVLPDLGALIDFFWRHKPSAPRGAWVPQTNRRTFRIATLIVEIVFGVAFLTVTPYQSLTETRQQQRDAKAAAPLVGAWHFDPAQPATGPFLTAEGLPATDLYVDSFGRTFTRSTDCALWRTEFKVDPAKKTVTIATVTRKPVTYSWQMPDAAHLVLAETGSPTMTLTRTPTPPHYPLLERGFHWVNEWGPGTLNSESTTRRQYE